MQPYVTIPAEPSSLSLMVYGLITIGCYLCITNKWRTRTHRASLKNVRDTSHVVTESGPTHMPGPIASGIDGMLEDIHADVRGLLEGIRQSSAPEYVPNSCDHPVGMKSEEPVATAGPQSQQYPHLTQSSESGRLF